MNGLKERSQQIHFVITATSRPCREGEVHGVDYFFVSKDEFNRMIGAEELIEHAIVYGDYKGIPKQQVRAAMASGKDVVMRIDVQGAATVRELAPEALLIFLTTETEDELINRLKARRTESKEALAMRIATVRQEMKRINEFDYVVVNREGCLAKTIDKIENIISAEHCRTHHRKVIL